MHVQSGVVTLQYRAGGQVAKPETKAHGSVHVLGGGHAFVHHGKGLARQGVLQAVGQKSRLVFSHQHRHAGATAHVAEQSLRVSFIGLRPHHHFYQWHQMGGHEKVQAQHASLAGQTLANRADGKARTVAGQYRVGRGELHQLGKQRLFGAQVLGNAFNHQGHIGPGHIAQIGHRLDVRGPPGKPQRGQGVQRAGCQFGAPRGRGVRHRHAATAPRQNNGHVGAHGACANDNGVCVAGVVR